MHAIPTVFIPALLCDGEIYREVIEHLGTGIAAQVAISPRPTLQASAAEILSRAPERFVLVGTSYGGNLALEVALAAPERVSALWLMGCNPRAAELGGPDLAAGLLADPRSVIELLAGLVVRPGAKAAADAFRQMAWRIGGEAGAAQARAVSSRQEAMSRLGRLTMPALLLWGADDPLAPVSLGQALASGLSKAQLRVLDACGHLPTLEKPAESAALFRKFLEEVDPA